MASTFFVSSAELRLKPTSCSLTLSGGTEARSRIVWRKACW
jgi:hypothetical protein